MRARRFRKSWINSDRMVSGPNGLTQAVRWFVDKILGYITYGPLIYYDSTAVTRISRKIATLNMKFSTDIENGQKNWPKIIAAFNHILNFDLHKKSWMDSKIKGDTVLRGRKVKINAAYFHDKHAPNEVIFCIKFSTSQGWQKSSFHPHFDHFRMILTF